jgi:hypothetical protein
MLSLYTPPYLSHLHESDAGRGIAFSITRYSQLISFSWITYIKRWHKFTETVQRQGSAENKGGIQLTNRVEDRLIDIHEHCPIEDRSVMASDQQNLQTMFLHPFQRRGIFLLLDVLDQSVPARMHYRLQSRLSLVADGEIITNINERMCPQEYLRSRDARGQ